MKNSNDPISFNIETEDCWNFKTNEPYNCYVVYRRRGNMAWFLGKFATLESANIVKDMMSKIRQEEISTGFDLQ